MGISIGSFRSVIVALMSVQAWALRMAGPARKDSRAVEPLIRAAEKDRVNSILVIRVDEIGDAVLSSAFLRNLRSAYPAARITLIAKEEVRALLLHCPYVDEVIGVRNTMGRLKRWLILPWAMRRFARTQLAGRHWSMVLLPRWDVDAHYASVIAYNVDCDVRVGYSESVNVRRRYLNAGFDRFLTHPVHDPESRHEVERALCLLRTLGCATDDGHLEVWTAAEDDRAAGRVLDEVGVPNGSPVIALAPAAGRVRRQWAGEAFAEIGRWCLAEPASRVIVVGGPGDGVLCQAVANAIGERAVSLAGRTSLRGSAALLKRCSVFVGNDSGPLHLAAAAGIPAVAISCHPKDGDPGDVQSPVRFGPWAKRALVVQPEHALAPCTITCRENEPHCIGQVSVDAVKAAITGVWKVPGSAAVSTNPT